MIEDMYYRVSASVSESASVSVPVSSREYQPIEHNMRCS